MMVILIIGKAMVLTIGSLAVAALFSWICWSAFKLVRHPELGVPLCLAAMLLAWGGVVTHSHFLRLVVVHVSLAALALWPVGLAWRRRFLNSHGERWP